MAGSRRKAALPIGGSMPGGFVNKAYVIIRPHAVTIPSVPAETLPVR